MPAPRRRPARPQTARVPPRAHEGAKPRAARRGVAHRNTRQRSAIEKVFDAPGRPLTSNEVHRRAQERVPGIGIATVYRALRCLLQEERLVTVRLPGERLAFEPSGRPHHHHFHCRVCRRTWDLAGCPLLVPIRVPRRFRVESHDLVVHGRCGDCGRGGNRRDEGTAPAGKQQSSRQPGGPKLSRSSRVR
jgi:Fur family ferric uptake transcriptional regulator